MRGAPSAIEVPRSGVSRCASAMFLRAARWIRDLSAQTPYRNIGSGSLPHDNPQIRHKPYALRGGMRLRPPCVASRALENVWQGAERDATS